MKEKIQDKTKSTPKEDLSNQDQEEESGDEGVCTFCLQCI